MFRAVFGCGDPAVEGWLRYDAVAVDRRARVVAQAASDGGRGVGCYRLGSFRCKLQGR